jgi:predicted amidophosphoribosyltransferase
MLRPPDNQEMWRARVEVVIPSRDAGFEITAAVCTGCGRTFEPTPNQLACCPSCRAAASRNAKVSKYRELRAGLDALFGVTDEHRS